MMNVLRCARQLELVSVTRTVAALSRPSVQSTLPQVSAAGGVGMTCPVARLESPSLVTTNVIVKIVNVVTS